MAIELENKSDSEADTTSIISLSAKSMPMLDALDTVPEEAKKLKTAY